MPANQVQKVKEVLTIPRVWMEMNLPGTSSKSCLSPFRREKTASFSVYDNGRKWKDFATGDGGDVIAFVQMVKNCSFKEALHFCEGLIGLTHRRK